MPTRKPAAEAFVAMPLTDPRIDWHCHILPGLDDGAESLSEALEIARILAGAGFVEIYCTPHCIRGLYDNTSQLVRRAVTELQSAIDRAGFALRLHAGMEYFLDEYFTQQLSDPLPLGDSNCLLVEISAQTDFERVKEQLFAIRRRGFTPLLAHPERYDFSAARRTSKNRGLLGKLKSRLVGGSTDPVLAPDPLRDLREMGCQFQGNLGSFAGIYGSEVKKLAEQLFSAAEYYCIGSDAHRANALESTLAKGLARVGAETGSLKV